MCGTPLSGTSFGPDVGVDFVQDFLTSLADVRLGGIDQSVLDPGGEVWLVILDGHIALLLFEYILLCEYRFLFSMLSHSCVPNTKSIISNISGSSARLEV